MIGVVNYKMGNIGSVIKKLRKIGGEAIEIKDSLGFDNCTKIILPGVGHFASGIKNLKELDLLDALNKCVISEKKPILGICLGMQLMAKHSEEGNTTGLGWIDAEVKRFKVSDTYKYKIPHTGWNQLSSKKQSRLLKNISPDSEYYFVHAYHVTCNKTTDILSETNYNYPFVSAFECDNIYGVQFHPEKSHDAGERLLANFLKI